ncbi:hypothetical protein NBRC116583_34300 [Arenicella sp. 4NH20-0111]|uniref:hypothetical protein n=1 Tax=Arenicella sp. 4NH20-0111 TaxID=3127648 RepID=UPI0031047C37
MTRILLVLVLANIAVFFWPTQANIAPHIYSEKPELNPHFVRLNKEIEERFYSQDKRSDFDQFDAQSQLPKVDTDEVLAQVGSSVSGSGVCYRLGPFMHQESYELAQAVLFNANVDYQKSARASQKSDVYRLFLGPFENSALVADARLELKRQRILDHFSRKLESGNYIISLGIYSSQETADTALRLFQGKLNDVKMQNETVLLPNSYWLHFVLGQSSSKLEKLSDIDWGENSVKLGPHTCRTQ